MAEHILKVIVAALNATEHAPERAPTVTLTRLSFAAPGGSAGHARRDDVEHLGCRRQFGEHHHRAQKDQQRQDPLQRRPGVGTGEQPGRHAEHPGQQQRDRDRVQHVPSRGAARRPAAGPLSFGAFPIPCYGTWAWLARPACFSSSCGGR
jgi:hypothetical protein